jgi:hypothetical protein
MPRTSCEIVHPTLVSRPSAARPGTQGYTSGLRFAILALGPDLVPLAQARSLHSSGTRERGCAAVRYVSDSTSSGRKCRRMRSTGSTKRASLRVWAPRDRGRSSVTMSAMRPGHDDATALYFSCYLQVRLAGLHLRGRLQPSCILAADVLHAACGARVGVGACGHRSLRSPGTRERG